MKIGTGFDQCFLIIMWGINMKNLVKHKDALEPTDEVAGFRVRAGFYLINGATALKNGVNFTIHSYNATSCELLLFKRREKEPYAVIRFPDSYRIFPIKDASAPESIESVCQLLDRMRHILSNPTNKIYLHCWGGVGRTGTIVACWIAREYGMTYYKTITNLLSMWKTCLKSANQSIPDHWSQKEFIKNFAEYHTPHVPLPTLFPPSP